MKPAAVVIAHRAENQVVFRQQTMERAGIDRISRAGDEPGFQPEVERHAEAIEPGAEV